MSLLSSSFSIATETVIVNTKTGDKNLQLLEGFCDGTQTEKGHQHMSMLQMAFESSPPHQWGFLIVQMLPSGIGINQSLVAMFGSSIQKSW